MFTANYHVKSDWYEEEAFHGVTLNLSPELTEVAISALSAEVVKNLAQGNYESAAAVAEGLRQASEALAKAKDAIAEEEAKAIRALAEFTDEEEEDDAEE